LKKYLYLFVCVLFCCLSACSPYNDSKQLEIIDSGTYYRIYHEVLTQVRYEIYNREGEVVLSDKTSRPLRINMINDDIIEIRIGAGSGVILRQYYSVSKNVFSQVFQNVFSNSDELIAYITIPKRKTMESRIVVVQNIFDKSLFYKEFQLELSNVIGSPITKAEFSKDGTSLQVTYLSGEDQTQVSTTLDLTLSNSSIPRETDEE